MNNEENNELKQNKNQNSEESIANNIIINNNNTNDINDINNADKVNDDNINNNKNENNQESEFNPYVSHEDTNSNNDVTNKSVNIVITRKDRTNFRKKLFIVVLFLCILSFVRSYNDIRLTQSNVTEPTTTISNIAKTDETVKNYNFEITFTNTNLDFKDYPVDTYIPEGYKVIEATFNMKNVSTKDNTIEVFECYADNVKCEPFNNVNNYTTPIGQNISPGREFANAKLYFIVPENAETIEIEYESNSYRDEKFIFVAKGNKVVVLGYTSEINKET